MFENFVLLQEPEWDVSSAFVAKVANHIRLRGQMGGATVSSSREDEENEGSGSQVPHTRTHIHYMLLLNLHLRLVVMNDISHCHFLRS